MQRQRRHHRTRTERRNPSRHHARKLPVSSHPEIEEEIRLHDGGLDPEQLPRASDSARTKGILSIDGEDVGVYHVDDKAA